MTEKAKPAEPKADNRGLRMECLRAAVDRCNGMDRAGLAKADDPILLAEKFFEWVTQ